MKKIVIIDDDQNEHQIFSEALHEIDINADCLFARNAEKAFNIFDSLIPDYIFLNLHIPKINGLACLAKIRELNHLRRVPVFLYSTMYDNAIRDKALELGATSCIRKPLTAKVLVHVLRKIILPADCYLMPAIRNYFQPATV